MNSELAERDELIIRFRSASIFLAEEEEEEEEARTVVSLLDITERKKAEKSLRESEKRFRALIEHSADGIVLLNADGTILYDSPSVNRIFGYTTEERRGYSVFEFMHPDECERAREVFMLFAQKPATSMTAQLRFRHKDGSWRWMESVRSNLLTEPSVGAIVVNYRDITERKRAEEALRESERKYREVIENASDVIYSTDPNGYFTFANPAGLRITGYSLEDLRRLNYLDLVLPEHRRRLRTAYLRQVHKKQGTTYVEFPFRIKSGDIRWLGQIASLVIDNGEVVAVDVIARDITERKLAEEALVKERQLLRTLVENIPSEISVKDTRGKIILANRATLRAFGLTAEEEVIGKSDFDFVKPELASQHYAEEQKILESGVPLLNDESTKRNSTTGEIEKCILRSKIPLRGAVGKISGLLCINQDITERKRAEEQLQESEQKYRDIVDFAPVGIYQALPDGTVITANHELSTLLGYDSADEFLGLRLGDDVYLDKEERHRFIEMYAPKGFASEVEVQWKKKDGTPIWVYLTAHAIKGSDGKTRYFEGFVQDITERKRAEERILLLARAVQSTTELISITDTEDRIVFVNKAFLDAYGYSEGEILGRRPEFLTSTTPSPRLEKQISRLSQRGGWHGELLNSRKNGSEFPIFLTTDKITDRTGETIGYIGVAQDITERKRVSDELKNSHKQLRALAAHLASVREEERSRIALEIHDELGQALTGLKIDLSLLQDAIAEVDRSEKTLTLSKKIRSMLELVDSTIESVRTISTELRPVVLDTLGLTAAIEWQAEEFERKTGISCKYSLPASDIILDRERSTAIFRIFQESLTNISRHAKASKVTVTLKHKHGGLLLVIKDNGIGLPQENLGNVKSFGILGMKERASILGGSFEISGVSGEGTTVSLRIPLPDDTRSEA